MIRDQYVPYRREDYIAHAALLLRQRGRNENLAYFDIVKFVETELLGKWGNKGTLQIEFYDAPEGGDLAFVKFDPLTLQVDREVWRLAKQGEPKARFIIAHEIGHIMLHEHDVQHFSNDPSVMLKYQEKEHSAEWQANTFASYFLVPSRLMVAFDKIEDMMQACAVDEPLILNRYDAENLLKIKRQRVVQDGQLCSTCGNFSVTGDGICRSDNCSTSKRRVG